LLSSLSGKPVTFHIVRMASFGDVVDLGAVGFARE
jgi:hypothetical protein